MSTDPITALIEALKDDQLEALAVRLAPLLAPKIEIGRARGDGPTPEDRSPLATIPEAAAYLKMTPRAIEGLLRSGRLTPVKLGMPKHTPRSRWRSWPTRIRWAEVEEFASGEPTGPVAEAARRVRVRVA